MLNYIKQSWLVLLLALLFGSALALVQAQLGPKIAQNKVKARQDAARTVVPGGKSVESLLVELKTGAVSVFRVLDADGKCVGWAVPAATMGYADKIEMIVGLSADLKSITDFKTIYSQETPGLGDKIKEKDFHRSFVDKGGRPADVQLVAAKGKAFDDIAGNEIVAITGATISSQAVCDAMYDSLAASGLIKKLAGGDFKSATKE